MSWVLRFRLEQPQHLLEHVRHVADDRHVDLDALGDGRRVDVDVDDLARVLRKVRRVADHAVVEARADREQHVAVLHRHVGLVGAVHAQHAEELLVGGRIAAQAHQRVGAGEAGAPHQLGELRRRVRQDHAAAGVHHRALRLEEQLHRLLDLPGVALAHRIVGAHRHRFRIDELAGLRGDVLGNVHQHRPGAPGGGEVERLLDGDGEVLHVLHQEVVLHAGPRDADRVALLERVLADGVRRHLSGDDHHRDRIHVRRGNAGDRVGDARTGGHQAHADLVRGARVAVGRVHRALLVPHQDVAHLVLLEQRVIDVQHRTARVAEEGVDALFLQAAHHDLGAGEFQTLDSIHDREGWGKR